MDSANLENLLPSKISRFTVYIRVTSLLAIAHYNSNTVDEITIATQ